MDSLDTSVLVRYFTNDDEVQSKIASELIVKYVGKEKSLFISNYSDMRASLGFN